MKTPAQNIVNLYLAFEEDIKTSAYSERKPIECKRVLIETIISELEGQKDDPLETMDIDSSVPTIQLEVMCRNHEIQNHNLRLDQRINEWKKLL